MKAPNLDVYLLGALDQWGGHSGRSDDHHYHAAPLHLQDVVGKDRPTAYTMDGYPIHGETETDGSPGGPIDQWNGHFDAENRYHHHGTRRYPYINGDSGASLECPEMRSVPNHAPVHSGRLARRCAT